MATRKQPAPKSYPYSVETFQDPGFAITRQAEPSAFNGMIRIRRYRVTVEIVDEPIDVLRERLRELWRSEPYNTHLAHPMRTAAEELGIELDDRERASKARRTR